MAVPFATAAILNSSVDNDKDGVKAVPAGFAITLPHCLIAYDNIKSSRILIYVKTKNKRVFRNCADR